MVALSAFYEAPDERAVREAWVAEFADALPHATRGAYVNFLTSTGDDETRRAYPPRTMERLAQVKRTYDPTNLFRRNHNIAPA
jgi:hypothetical protein